MARKKKVDAEPYFPQVIYIVDVPGAGLFSAHDENELASLLESYDFAGKVPKVAIYVKDAVRTAKLCPAYVEFTD